MERSTSPRRQDEGVTAPPARALREEIAALREEMREVREALQAAAGREIAVEAIFAAGYEKAAGGLRPHRRTPRPARPGGRPSHLRLAVGGEP